MILIEFDFDWFDWFWMNLILIDFDWFWFWMNFYMILKLLNPGIEFYKYLLIFVI